MTIFEWFVRLPARKLLVVVALLGSGGGWAAAPLKVAARAREAQSVPFLWGAQYYRAPTPDEDCWEGDLRTMRELGFNSVKFWVQWRGSHAEPGRYKFEDLDRLMDIASKNGLKVTLNTIFDIAPVWLYERFTQLLSAAQGRVTYNVESHINGGQTSLHQKVNRLPELRREFLPQLGLGVRGFLFWQYRPELLGGESPGWCLVRPDGSPRPATEAANEFWSKLRPHAEKLMKNFSPAPRVAIWKNRRNELFHFASDGDLSKLADAVEAYTEALYWNNVPCRYVDSQVLADGGLDGIRLLIMPSAYYLSEPEAQALDRWVRGGGVLLSEAHLGGYNDTTGRHSRVMPGCGLAESWGIRKTESTASVHLAQSLGKEALPADMNSDVRKAFEHFGVTGGKFFPAELSVGVAMAGCDRFATLAGEDIQVEGKYADGVPVVVSKQVGAGRVIYCGTNPGQGRAKLPEGFRDLVGRALRAADVKPVLGCLTDEPETVRVDIIGSDEIRPAFITVFNRTDKQQTARFSGSGRYRGVFSGMELTLENSGALAFPPDFAELFVREETAPR